jgi:type I restriction enzyme S subunit
MGTDKWQQGKLSDVIKLISGQHIEAKKANTKGEGIPYLTGPADFPNGKIVISKYTLFPKVKCQAGDHLITVKGSGTGKIVTVNQECCISRQLMAARPIDNKFDSQYLFYLLNKNTKLYENSANGLIPGISRSDILNTPIKIPPLHEQKKIANILNAWDRAITKTENLIANSQQQKKTLMQQLLSGNKRFSGFKGEWREISIKEMGKVVSGGTPDTNVQSYWNGSILWATPTDITALKNRYIVDTERKISKEGIINSSATLLPPGSLLVCTRATIGWMAISTSNIATNQGFKSLIPNNSHDVGFLYYLFSFYKNKFIRLACGSTFAELSKGDFESLSFKCPSIHEQQKIEAILAISDNEIECLEKKLYGLKQEKKALMQQLLTGKKRVKM